MDKKKADTSACRVNFLRSFPTYGHDKGLQEISEKCIEISEITLKQQVLKKEYLENSYYQKHFIETYKNRRDSLEIHKTEKNQIRLDILRKIKKERKKKKIQNIP